MSYLRGGSDMNRMDGDNHENVYKRFGMVSKEGGMKYELVEVMKQSTLRYCGHLVRMSVSELTRSIDVQPLI